MWPILTPNPAPNSTHTNQSIFFPLVFMSPLLLSSYHTQSTEHMSPEREKTENTSAGARFLIGMFSDNNTLTLCLHRKYLMLQCR